jgi:hypothetical protein
MYRKFYMNASNVADMIRSGDYQKTTAAIREDRQGLMLRKQRTEREELGRQEEDPVSMIADYLNTIREVRDEVVTATPEAPTSGDTEASTASASYTSASSGAWDYNNYEDFADRLMMSESSGRSDVQIQATSGGRVQNMTGLFQFSDGRLTDYKNDTGASFTTEEFRNDPELQREVFAWHMRDIDRVIDENNFLDLGYSRDGLRAVAHLGGINGMKRWVRTGGEYNPDDSDRPGVRGTSLSDYYEDFSG